VHKGGSSYQGNGYYGGGSSQATGRSGTGKGGRADHLKDWQFKKGENAQGQPNPDSRSIANAANSNNVNGNRMGPTVRQGSSTTVNGAPYHSDRLGEVGDGRVPFDFGGEFWAMSGDGGGGILVPPGLEGADAVFARALEHPELYDEEGYNLGKAVGESSVSGVKDLNLAAASDSPVVLDKDVPELSHHMFEELTINHGKDVAVAYCLIDDFMCQLDGKDDLIRDLINDLFQFTSAEGQLQTFRSLYEVLPRKDQEKLAAFGM
jgi:hypothetical protein